MKSIKIVAASIAALTLAGCANDEYIGNGESPQQSKNTEISFAMKTPNMTRAEITGESAANALGRQFYVYGAKNVTPTGGDTKYQVVFDDYSVWYNGGKSSSNSVGWEYVGTAASFTAQTGITRQTAVKGNDQTIKYWDYTAPDYWFYAVSNANVAANAETSTPASEIHNFTPGTDGKITSITVTNVGENNTVFYADAVKREKYAQHLANGQTSENGEPVKFTFKRLQSKVRIGFYETVPGYAIKDVKFYTISGTTPTDNVNLMSTATPGTDGKYTTGFITSADYTINFDHEHDGKASLTSSSTLGGEKAFGQLTYTKPLSTTGESANYMGTTAAEATWAEKTGNTNHYFIVLPNEDKSASFKIKVDYTLVSLDGTKETIKVTGATATVPATYCKWMGNYAYTYLFKISDNTNGSTGTWDDDGDPDTPEVPVVGLYPITFDACVVETVDATQETITTVATPSITTYAEGSDVTSNNEYKASETIILNVEGATATAWEYYVSSSAITEQEAAITTATYTEITATDGKYKLQPTSAAGKYVVVRMTYTEGEGTDATTKYAYKVIKIKAAP